MSTAKSRRLMGQMNVVPYIDVMLVLLIIFMVTAPLLEQGIKVELPEVDAAPIEVADDNEPVVVSVNASGQLFMNLGETPDQPITEEELLRRIRAVVNANAATPVFIKGDTAVDYGVVARALALLQRAGATGIGMITETPDDLPDVSDDPEAVPE